MGSYSCQSIKVTRSLISASDKQANKASPLTCKDGTLLGPHDEVVHVAVWESHARHSHRTRLFVLQLHGFLQGGRLVLINIDT